MDQQLYRESFLDEKGVNCIATKKRVPIKLRKPYLITEEVAVWRKVYELHAWFVARYRSRFTDGYIAEVDHDTRMDFDIDDIRDLLRVVQEVLAEPKKAAELLPYDSKLLVFWEADAKAGVDEEAWKQYLLQQLEYTKAQLEKIIEEHATWPLDVYYVYEYTD